MAQAHPGSDAAIREQAYYFWEQDGRPDGRETEYWMRAAVAVAEKAQLDTLTKPAPKKAAKTKAAAAKSSCCAQGQGGGEQGEGRAGKVGEAPIRRPSRRRNRGDSPVSAKRGGGEGLSC